MKWFINLGMLTVLSIALIAGASNAQETKYDTGTVSAAVSFGPVPGKRTVTAVYALTDTNANAAVSFWARGGAGRVGTTANATNTATQIFVSNTGNALTTNETVVYVHFNGTLDTTTISANTTSNITLAAGITVAGTNGDYVYEVTKQGEYGFDVTGAVNGQTNKYGATTGKVFVSPGDSPVYCELNGASKCVLTVTAD